MTPCLKPNTSMFHAASFLVSIREQIMGVEILKMIQVMTSNLLAWGLGGLLQTTSKEPGF